MPVSCLKYCRRALRGVLSSEQPGFRVMAMETSSVARVIVCFVLGCRLFQKGRLLDQLTGAKPVQLRQLLTHYYRPQRQSP